MKKFILSILILFVFIKISHAQYRGAIDDKTLFFSVGGSIGAPSNTPYSITYGASAQAEAKLSNQFGLTLAGEYVAYKYKNAFNINIDQHPALVPLKAGLRYYTTPGFYLAGELGSTVKSNNDTPNMLVYSLGFGFEIPLDKHSDVEIGFAYQSYPRNQYQTTALRAAYRIGW